MAFMTYWTWLNYPDIEPVESTQKHTSMKPKAGIWASRDLDLFSFAVFPTLLDLLPVLAIAVVEATTGTGGSGTKADKALGTLLLVPPVVVTLLLATLLVLDDPPLRANLLLPFLMLFFLFWGLEAF